MKETVQKDVAPKSLILSWHTVTLNDGAPQPGIHGINV